MDPTMVQQKVSDMANLRLLLQLHQAHRRLDVVQILGVILARQIVVALRILDELILDDFLS